MFALLFQAEESRFLFLEHQKITIIFQLLVMEPKERKEDELEREIN